MKSFDVVKVMGQYSKEFLSGRFASDLWPLLKNVLIEESNDIFTKNYTKYTIPFQFKLSMLQCLVQISTFVTLNETLVHDIMKYCKGYLSSKQPTEFQVETFSIFKALMKTDVDSVWYIVNELKGTIYSNLPHNQAKPITFQAIGIEHNDYLDNATLLLKEIDDFDQFEKVVQE